MPRPTKAEIAADIVEHAAALFARHGVDHTSLQQIADAVNYSKAGVLNHYPSKNAIYEAVIKTVRDHVLELRDRVAAIPVGAQRDRVLVEAEVQFTYDWPGIAAFSNRLAYSEPETDPELVEIGLILYEALGIDVRNTTLDRLARVTAAFSGLSVTALTATRADQKSLWYEHIVRTAMEALGHGHPRSTEGS